MAELKKIIVDGVEHTLPEGGGTSGLTEERVNELIDAKITAVIDAEY